MVYRHYITNACCLLVYFVVNYNSLVALNMQGTNV